MARNSEKAQSMLFRFRESQAVEMGLGSRVKGARRPRMASAVSSLRECEMWRGDIMRDVSRKVSKIQDGVVATLTDYEIRDLNDEINGLMREKRHWETQIVALGGANYKRGNQSMVDDEGREVPGTRGYKYFGRAKELPGVKEMFTHGAQAASEESARNASFQMFRNQGPGYFGDNDEGDAALAEEEEELARRGEPNHTCTTHSADIDRVDWESSVAETASTLALPETTTLPYPAASKPVAPVDEPEEQTPSKGRPKAKSRSKRKAATETETEDADGEAASKKAKTDEETNGGAMAAADPVMAQQAASAASFFGVLDPESLRMPTLPTTEEMGKVLLEVRKKALRDEYGV